jgi:hypothetical protein
MINPYWYCNLSLILYTIVTWNAILVNAEPFGTSLKKLIAL